MRTIGLLSWFVLSVPTLAVELQVHRDVPYAGVDDPLRSLDIHAPSGAKDLPVVVWIHGGGWRQGDKNGVQKKPAAFAERGFVFVSINYRLSPHVTIREMTGDVARAIRWVNDHAAQYGGKPDSIFIMGHSAGAHLAALVCTDDRYLKAEGSSLSIIKGCVPIDVSVYDIPKRLADGGQVSSKTFTDLFGETTADQQRLSPAVHVARGKNIPSFLILHVADRPDTQAQSNHLARLLQASGIAARVVAGEGKTHGTIGSDLGLPDDPPTQAVFEFLRAASKS